MKIIPLDKGCFAFILGLLLWFADAQAHSFSSYTALPCYQSNVTGEISDTDGPLPGVSITVKGTGRSAVSDGDGRYTIMAAPGDTLVFSMIGYTIVEQVVTSSVLDVLMSQDSTQLEEVMINAGYYSVKDRDRTGSIARITAKDIAGQPVTNILATMQGRMAGVSVTQNTGVPGGGFSIEIRGRNSIRAAGNNPLFVVDGVPYGSDAIGSGSTSTAFPGTNNPLNSINPADIESIEVLKDADATAIYGSRGANGVVLITTKRGKAGKTTFSVNYSHGLGRVTRFMDLLSTPEYLKMREEAFANDGIEYGPTDYDVNGTWDRNRYTNWQKKLLGGTSEITNAQASVSGGSENTQFHFAGTYYGEGTVFIGDFGYNKYSGRFQANHQSTDKRFRMNVTAGYTAQDNDQPASDPTLVAAMLAPNAPALYDSEGNINWEGSTWKNPLGELKGKFISNTNDFIANAMVSYSLFDGLEAKASLGYTDTRHNEWRIQPSTMYDPAYEVGSEYSSVFNTTTSRRSYIFEPQVNWKKQFSKVSLDVLAGSTFQEQKGSQLVLYGSGFANNSLLYNLASAYELAALLSADSQYRYQAVFGRVNVNWDGKYILNLTGRRDGSSRFGPGRQFADFGAIGAAWLFSREEFISSALPVMSLGKLRVSYGSTGSDQIGDYQYLDTYTSSGNNYGGISGLQPTRLFNPDFGWEVNTKFETALELGFFKDRLVFNAGWYRNTSSSQLVGIPLSSTTGFSSFQSNLDATVRNSGVELALQGAVFQNGDCKWNTSVNLTIARNKLIEYPNLERSSYRNTYIIGESLNIVRVYQSEGVDPQTGVYRFKDFNGDGVITAENDQKAIADLNPKFFGGLQNTFTYKGLALDFLFQFVKRDNYNELLSSDVPGMMINQPAGVIQRWQAQGDNAPVQRFTTGVDSGAVNAFYQYMASNAAITDASYIRLKNISLSYTLPERWVGGLNCRLVMTGQNLLTFTNYRGRDPEFTAVNYLPPLKIFTTGIQLNF
jgi:TonB-linked SusC/RagA family outer membrane protein